MNIKKVLLITGFLLLGVGVVALSSSIEDAVMRFALVLFALGSTGVLFGQKRFLNFGAASDFSPSALLAYQVPADELWASSTITNEFVANVEVVKAIKANQTARLAPLTGSEKDRTLRLIWLSACDLALSDVTNDCSWTGTELQSNVKEMTLTRRKSVAFFVNDKEWRSNQFNKEEAIAKGMLKAMKLLDNHIAAETVPYLNSFAGVNQYQGGLAQGTGYDTIPAAYWTADLFGEFHLLAKYNHFQSPYLISGKNLYKEGWNAQMNVVNSDSKDELNKFNSMRAYYDIFNIDTVNTPDYSTFLMDVGAVALESKVYYPNMVEYRFDTRYSVASKNIPGISYDVIYKEACANNEITHNFLLTATWGIWNNPVGCDTDETGVLRFFNNTQSGS